MPAGLIKIKSFKGVYYRPSSEKIVETIDDATGKTTKREKYNRVHHGKPDRCFYVTYRNSAGKFVREKVGWQSEGYTAALADQVRAERIRSLRHGKELPDKKRAELTFGDAWKRYDEWLDTGKKHVYDDRNRYENYVKPRFATKALSQITTHDLEQFKDKLLKKGLAPATVKHVIVIIRQVYNKAIAWKLWEGTPPTRGFSMPKLNNKRQRFLSRDEAKSLLETIKKKSETQYEMGLISLHTGMRASEVFALLWGHVDLDRGVIHVADPKGGAARDAYMTKTLKTLFAAKKEGKPSELIYQNRDGKPFGEVSKTWLRTIQKLGLNKGIEDRRQKVSFHTLRHTFASWLAIQGTPILEIKELLGHATLAMTERYAHLIPDNKRVAVARLDEGYRDDEKQENKKGGEPEVT